MKNFYKYVILTHYKSFAAFYMKHFSFIRYLGSVF